MQTGTIGTSTGVESPSTSLLESIEAMSLVLGRLTVSMGTDVVPLRRLRLFLLLALARDPRGMDFNDIMRKLGVGQPNKVTLHSDPLIALGYLDRVNHEGLNFLMVTKVGREVLNLAFLPN